MSDRGLLCAARDAVARALDRIARPGTTASGSETDALTGLSDRGAFERFALSALARRRYRGEGSGLLRIAIDRLAEINETFGHAAGDELVRQAAKRLKAALSGDAAIGRLGGAAFAALTPAGEPGIGARAAAAAADALAAPFEIEGMAIPTAVSIGLAQAPADGEDLPELLRRAELARLRAKAESPGHWRRFDAALDNAVAARRELEAALGEARGEGRLTLHYQPIVEVATGRIRGFEALLRWRHPTLGLVGAQDFVPLAEECGLIGTIGQWALDEACREAAGWPSGLRVAVNVSPVQLRAGVLPGEVARALKVSGLEPTRLEIEVTEGVLIGDRDFARRELERLGALGVGLAIDDFGAGFASFGYLSSLPFTSLKIDQSFLRDMNARPNNAVVIKSIASLARDLGLGLVVEGVDTQAQRDWLIENGCVEAQGFLFGRPMPAEDARRLIAGA